MSNIDDQTHFHPEDGIFSPPEPLPNSKDLSNGSAGNQLRYGVLNLDDPKIVRRFNMVLAWLKQGGGPTDNYLFFTPVLSGGFGSTQIIFSDADGKVSAHDATHLYNDPETAIARLRFAHGFPVKQGYINFPGFADLEDDSQDPVGSPLPVFNTPGWARDFARYYSVVPGFDPKKWPIGSIFHRSSTTDEEFKRDSKMIGFKPRTDGYWGTIPDIQPVWERIR